MSGRKERIFKGYGSFRMFEIKGNREIRRGTGCS